VSLGARLFRLWIVLAIAWLAAWAAVAIGAFGEAPFDDYYAMHPLAAVLRAFLPPVTVLGLGWSLVSRTSLRTRLFRAWAVLAVTWIVAWAAIGYSDVEFDLPLAHFPAPNWQIAHDASERVVGEIRTVAPLATAPPLDVEPQ
jgi:hypothetical protein